MKNTKLDEVCSKRYIPSELWPEILCRLPVKSLLRFRCASRSWLSLIDDRDFARLHLKTFKNNCDETHLLVIQGQQQNCVVWCSDTFETNSETLLTLGHPVRDTSWNFVCSVDGLVMLKRDGRLGPSGVISDLKVWNPSIRKFHEIPSLPTIDKSPNCFYVDDDIGFGYDPLADDYKHVKIIYEDKNPHIAAVYSLGTGSWKIIPCQGKGCSWQSNKWFIGWKGNVYFQGSLYFVGSFKGNIRLPELVSYDLSSEVFSSISLPDDPHFRSPDLEPNFELMLIEGGCSLAILDSSYPEKSVWVLESSGDERDSMCWKKRHSFHLQFDRPLYFKKNGDLLTQRRREEESENWDEVGSCNLETEEYKIVREKESSYCMNVHVSTHVSAYYESLVLLK